MNNDDEVVYPLDKYNDEEKTMLTTAQQLAAHEATLLGAATGLFPSNAATAAAVATARAAVLARMT